MAAEAATLFSRRSLALARTNSAGTRAIHDELSAAQRTKLAAQFGRENVDDVEAGARALFRQVDTEKNGLLGRDEFHAVLGALGAMSTPGSGGLGDFMFRAVDYDDSGSVGFVEFLEWMLTMTSGSREQKLRFGFKICDFDRSGDVHRDELSDLLQSMFQVLSGLSLDVHNTEIAEFVDKLFTSFDKDQSGTLTWEEYKRACEQESIYFESLMGHTATQRADSCAAASGAVVTADADATGANARGSRLFFGQEKWEFMLTLMLGLQIAIEATEDLDVAEDSALLRSWSDSSPLDSTADATATAAVSDVEGDTDEGDEPIAEHEYKFPLRVNSKEAQENAHCAGLVAAVTTARGEPGATAPEKDLAAMLHAAQRPELSVALSRALADRLHHQHATVKLKAMAAIRAIANQQTSGKIPLHLLPAMESVGVLRELRAARDNYTAVDLAVVEAQKVKAAAAATMALIVGSSAKPQRSIRGGGGLAGSVIASKAAADSESESERASITVIGGAVFRKIRKAFGIGSASFLRSLGVRQILCGLLMGDLRGLAEQVSEGKSRSLFYWSFDARFMVKTITADERDTMKKMLRGYLKHVTTFPDTLLVKLLGLFDLRVALPNGNGTKLYHCCVMGNVFHTHLPIHERFDLKGSSFQRTVGVAQRGQPGLVHKDQDFVAMGRCIRLPDARVATKLKRQILIDSNFLLQMGVIDYSLLVGISRRRIPGGCSGDEGCCGPEMEQALAVQCQRLQLLATATSQTAKGISDASSSSAQPRLRAPTLFDTWRRENDTLLRDKFEELTGGSSHVQPQPQRQTAAVLGSRGTSKQSLLLDQLQKDPDNLDLLRELQKLHVVMSQEVLAELEQPQPEQHGRAFRNGGTFCDRLHFDQFVSFAWQNSSVGGAATVAVGTPPHSPMMHANDASAASATGCIDGEQTTASTDMGDAAGTLFTSHHGGLRGFSSRAPPGHENGDDHTAEIAEEGDDIFFLGIVDILVPFKLRKRMEHRAKSILQHGKNFSVVPPRLYADRLNDFIAEQVIG